MHHELDSRPRRGFFGRTLGFGCLSLLAVLLICLFGYVRWANTLPPPEPDPTVLPNPNGFDACVAAAASIPTPPVGSPLETPNAASPADLRAALQPEEPGLNALRNAMKLPYVTPSSVSSSAAPFRYLADYRNAARGFAAESEVAAAEGRWGDAMERALDAAELGAKSGRNGLVVHGLVAVAIEQLILRRARGCVPHLTAEEARAAGARLDRIRAAFPSTADAFRVERRRTLASVRDLITGFITSRDLARVGMTPSQRGVVDGPMRALYPKPWVYHSLDRYYRHLIAEAEKPYWQQQPVPVPREPFTQALAPTPMFWSAVRRWVETRGKLDRLRLELALQDYRARTGAYPATLQALVPRYVKQVPLDPLTGTPLVYRPDGGSYQLYAAAPTGGAIAELTAGKLGARVKRRGGARLKVPG